MSENQVNLLDLENVKPLDAAAGLMHHQQVKTRLAKRTFHNLAHHRGIVDDQGSNFTHARAPLRCLSSLRLKS